MIAEITSKPDYKKGEEIPEKHQLASSKGKMIWILSVLLAVCVIFSAGNGALHISVAELGEIIAS
jgi:hypothetical protein